MIPTPTDKYRAFPPIDLPDRQWPSRTLTAPPIWCSVDLRDGNQALVEPMDAERKLRMFEKLVSMGFKEIEVGFPASSEPDFDFVRQLVEQDRVPDDVTIQVLTQARGPLIDRTMDSIRGARRAIVHLYNSTSELQRRVVFGLDRPGIVDIATRGARRIVQRAERMPETDVLLEYSPESFTGTELDFAIEICEAVMDIWQPSPSRKIILNLPATVEMATPNIYADQIEWFSRNIRQRDAIVLSLHPHNDRGTAVAAAELALMAGAERVEGTLFGNGERTGNVDVVTLALNLYSQGIAPGIDVFDIDEVVRIAEFCNRLPVHPRHPYAGELVYTAFSGSHQDAIGKGFRALRASGSELWEVPYLPIDPADVGRSYEAVVRVNSQSGKGGVAFVLEQDYGFELPRGLRVEFSAVVQKLAEQTGGEIVPAAIWQAFEGEYLSDQGRFRLVAHRVAREAESVARCRVEAVILERGTERAIAGEGRGPIEAFVDALRSGVEVELQVLDYHEHALGQGADAAAVAYVEVKSPEGVALFGVGRDDDIVTASLRAVVSALNRCCV